METKANKIISLLTITDRIKQQQNLWFVAALHLLYWMFSVSVVKYRLVFCRVSVNILKSSSLLCSRLCLAYTSVHRGLLRQPVCDDGSSRDERIPDQPRRLSWSHLTTDECCSCCCLWTLTNCNYSRFSSSHIFIHIFHLHQFDTTSPQQRLYEWSSVAVGCRVFE